MRVTFRQGIVRYPASGSIQQFLQINGAYVDLNATNGPTEITLAHKSTNYLHVENATVSQAWGPFTGGTNNWLYWDIDLRTGQRTFGHTIIQPVAMASAPASPVQDMHWFDTTNAVMKIYTTSGWREVVRVFAAYYDGANFTPFGAGVTGLPFAGTQVGLNVDILAGRIIYDDVGNPIKRATGEFFTLEDQFFATGSTVNAIRLESNVSQVEAGENLPAFHVVALSSSGALLANYENTGETVLAMTTESSITGEITNVVIQGVVTNIGWNFTNIGANLWVDTAGILVDVDPNITDNIAHPKAKVPVARVLSPNSIIFEQGLGGKGEKGDAGDVVGVVSATPTIEGVVTTTTVTNNKVVSDDDPRMTDARTPLPHVHSASDVTFLPYNDIVSANVQNAIQELEDEKVSVIGDTMTGALTLNGNPTANLHAATKQYVDGLVSGLIWLDPVHYINLVGDNVTDPSTLTPKYSDVHIVPTGAVGAWAGLDGKVVIWNGASWVEDTDDGLLSAHPVGTRFGITFETSSAASGTFAGKENQIAILDNPAGPVWSFYTPIANNAVFVNNGESLHAFHQYAYNDSTSSWVEFGGGSSVTPGTNLTQTGNILDVKQYSSGGTVEADTLRGSVPADFAAAVHTHTISDTTNLQTELDKKVSAENISSDLGPNGLATRAAFGGPYINSSSKPLMVNVNVDGVGVAPSSFIVDGTTISRFSMSPNIFELTIQITHCVVVPAGSTYQLTGSGTVVTWFEVQ